MYIEYERKGRERETHAHTRTDEHTTSTRKGDTDVILPILLPEEQVLLQCVAVCCSVL